jgi:uncharacterized damage-inducible protein DinB
VLVFLVSFPLSADRPRSGTCPADRDRSVTWNPLAQCGGTGHDAGVTAVERVEPPLTGGERETLRDYLDFHRATLALKCEGLSDEQLRRRAMPPSSLSLLGLVRHLAEVERSWFRRVVDGEDVPLVWSDDGDFQAAHDATGGTREEAFTAWRREVELARRIERAAPSLDVTGVDRTTGEAYSLRLVMLHLIQEYARHNGHADLLREAIDGAVGV